jgi:fatty acid desaturase
MHFSVTTILPSLFLGFEPVIVFRLLVTACHGYTMLAVLGPSHLAAPAICVATPPAPSDSAAWQIVSTVNYRTGWIGRLICAGTGYHIEHHLFPGVAHVYYPEISELVRRYCEREGLPYNSFSWEGAILRCFATMSNPPEVLPRWPAPTGPRTAEPSSQPSLSNFRDSSGLSKDSASAA